MTKESDFVSRAVMRDEISDGGHAHVCTLSSEACVAQPVVTLETCVSQGLQAGSPSIQPESRVVFR